ncbi:MAG: DUF1501 domain-containing protein [Myxococcales bacterium]|nr:DUF1501 domain-containing protein [Myxococcales bacterium]
MYIETNRRAFLRATGLGIAGLSLGGLGRAMAQTANDQVLLTVFLRGASDGMSWLHPRPGTSAARVKYESYRGAGTRILNGINVPSNMAMHPALAALRPAMRAGEATLVAGVAGAVENRSHFQQQDLVESGSSNGTPRRDGVLGRALGELSLVGAGLAGLSLNTQSPFLLRSTTSGGLTAPDLRGFGRLNNGTYVNAAALDLQERVRRLYVPNDTCTTGTCEAGRQATDALATYGAISASAGLPGGKAANLGETLTDLAKLIAADTSGAFKFINVDIGGWDTHLNQGSDAQTNGAFTGTLAKNLEGLANALAAFNTEAHAQGCWNRVNVLVITEFGRTTRENGTAGTDHGYGSVALVMGSGLRAQVSAQGYFPNDAGAAYYAEAEAGNALPRLVEHRQLMDEILRQRFGLDNTAMGAVLPGFTRDTGYPSLYV